MTSSSFVPSKMKSSTSAALLIGSVTPCPYVKCAGATSGSLRTSLIT